MNEPERLAEGKSELLRSMLHAAREEGPSDASVQRTLAAVGVGATVLTATAGVAAGVVGGAATSAAGAMATAGSATGSAVSAASVVAKVAPFGLFGVGVKWVGIGVVGGLLTAGIARQVSVWEAPAEVAASAPAAAPVAVAPARGQGDERPTAPAVAPGEDEPAAVEPSVRVNEPPRVESTREPAVRSAPPLAAEVRAVDRAREAVAAGDAQRALAELDSYDRSFAERRLTPEALYLRMQALAQRGDSQGSQAAARKILLLDPNGPHAAGARAVLAGQKPRNLADPIP